VPPFTRAREFGVAVFVHLRAVVTARRFPLIVLIHGTLMVAASYLALWLRFDGAIPPELASTYVQLLPELLLIRGIAFMALGLGGGLVTVLFFAVWPRVFGRRHLGQIQGAAQAITEIEIGVRWRSVSRFSALTVTISNPPYSLLLAATAWP